jgi:hypothetical protein
MIEAVSKPTEIYAFVQRTREIVHFVKSHKYVQELFDKTRSPSIKARTLYESTHFALCH